MSHDEATEVKRLGELSTDLYAVYSMKAASTPELTQRVLDELRKLKISRDVDGSFLLKVLFFFFVGSSQCVHLPFQGCYQTTIFSIFGLKQFHPFCT